MLFLDENDIKKIGISWYELIQVIHNAVLCLDAQDFVQPLKPYLRYRNKKNRIIAMPAFLGGNINLAGIKWIASFPDNVDKGIPRAHSVVILNDADTGVTLAIICTPLLSIIRTASVSGLMIKSFTKVRNLNKINIGIVGFGPIGQYHLQMCLALLGNNIDKVFIYDIRPINPSAIPANEKIEVVNNWQDAYLNADIFITCTVADERYINRPPKAGSLHINVSLRDYQIDTFEYFKESIIVDNWDEVCRENTDIELMHQKKGLKEKDTLSLVDIVSNNSLMKLNRDTPIMFNPMGMAVFDIAVGNYYYHAKL